MQVGELFVALGFDVDDAKLKSFNDGIKSSMTDLLKMSGIAAGAVYSVNKFIESSLHNSVALRQFTAETGESSEALKKWQIAAQRINTEMGIDEVTEAFKRMNSAIAAAQYSGEKGGVFAQLGIENVQSKTSEELLNELRQNFQMNVGRWGLPKTLDFMEQLGVPKSMARTFQLSDEDIDRMTRGLITTENQTEAITKLADKLRLVSLEWQHFKEITTAEYSDNLIVFIDNLSTSLKTFYDNMKSVIDKSDDLSGGFKVMAGGAAVIVSALFPLTSLLAGLLAFFNDFGAYTKGMPSMIGDAINFAKDVKKDALLNYNKEGQSLGDFMKEGGIYHENGVLIPNIPNQQPSQNTVTMSNTFNIQSTADSKDVAQEVGFYQQLELNRAYSQLNRGGF